MSSILLFISSSRLFDLSFHPQNSIHFDKEEELKLQEDSRA
jgi:hypothetical protein